MIADRALICVSYIGSTPSEETGKQSLCVWHLDTGSLAAATLIPAGDYQHSVRFRPEDHREIVTNGKVRVFFWTWEMAEHDVHQMMHMQQNHVHENDDASTMSDYKNTNTSASSIKMATRATSAAESEEADASPGEASGIVACGGRPGTGSDIGLPSAPPTMTGTSGAAASMTAKPTPSGREASGTVHAMSAADLEEAELTVGTVRFYSPPVSDRDFKQRVGEYVSSIFVPGSTAAVTGTHDGDLVVWELAKTRAMMMDTAAAAAASMDSSSNHDALQANGTVPGAEASAGSINGMPASNVHQPRRATKILRVLPSGMSSLVRSDKHMYCGSRDGGVRVFNSRLSLVTWKDNIDTGAVLSIGISGEKEKNGGMDGATDAEHAVAGLSHDDEEVSSAFVVTTSANRLLMVSPFDDDSSPPRVLLQGPRGATALASHPTAPLLATVGDLGCVDVWDLESRRLLRCEPTASSSAAAAAAAASVAGKHAAASASDADKTFAGGDGAASASGAPGASARGTAISFVGPAMDTLCVGYSNGLLRFLNLGDLSELHWVKVGHHAILGIVPSGCSSMVATYDAGRTVTLLLSSSSSPASSTLQQQQQHQQQLAGASQAHACTSAADVVGGGATSIGAVPVSGTAGPRWELVGKHRAHAGAIRGLTFAGSRGDRLFSVGTDCRLVEYASSCSSSSHSSSSPQLPPSSKGHVQAGAGLQIKGITELITNASPSSMMAVNASVADSSYAATAAAPGTGELVHQLLICDEEFKVRRYCIDNLHGHGHGRADGLLHGVELNEEEEDGGIVCDSTVLGPTYGGPLSFICHAPQRPWVAFASSEKVVGVGMLPLDGSPNRCTALIAHPGRISSIRVVGGHQSLLASTSNHSSISSSFHAHAPPTSNVAACSSVNSRQHHPLGIQDGHTAAAAAAAAHIGGGHGSVDQMVSGMGTARALGAGTMSATGGILAIWRVDEASLADRALQEEAEAAAAGVSKFTGMIEGGATGDVYEELLNYFYFAQVRAQGENSLDKRKISDRVSFEEVPGLMRALGYYPSEAELKEIFHEARGLAAVSDAGAAKRRPTKTAAAASTAASSADDTGDGATPAVSASAEIGAHSSGAEAGTLRLDDFVRLYTNHRPLYSVGLDDVQRAFLRLGCDSVTGKLSWSTLKAALCHEGEPMHEEELAACMYNLIGVEDAKLPPLDSEQFASAVLGFEVLP